MISIDILLTGVIVAAAVAWAGRGLWRWLRRRSGGPSATPPCGGTGGGCGNCPGGEARVAATPADADPCGERQPDKS